MIVAAGKKSIMVGMLVWYVGLFVWMAQAPADPQFWVMASILPFLFVVALVASHRFMPLSSASYGLITLYLSLHTVAVHYTYAQVPAGLWLAQSMDLGRNHFDRVVHFSFGFLLSYPLEEMFRLLSGARGWLIYYLPVMTVLGLSGLWEIIEAWVAQAVHPELGITYLGSQGDVWDAQQDMAAALCGSLLCIVLVAGIRLVRAVGTSVSEPDLINKPT